jgi:hypothetical protein
MTTPALSPRVVEAAAFLQRHHGHLAIDHPAMAVAARTLRSAGVWSPGEVIAPQHETPVIDVALVGIFCAGDRHRTLYSILADGVEVGTAIHWTSKTAWPWGLNLPAACIVNFGFRNKADLLRAVQRFVKTGEI